MRHLLFFLLVFSLAPAQAAIEAYEFDSPEMESDYNRLIDELRCLVCQNQNLAESDAPLAKDLRQTTYEMLKAGKSSSQVVDFMVARYGEFVLFRPRFHASTYLLWLGPIVLLGLVLFVVARRLNRAKASAVDADALASARQLLENDDEPGK